MTVQKETLNITDIGAGGDGIAHLDGRPVFVPFTITGDSVIGDVVEEKGGLRARTVEMITPSPDRIVPPCPHFALCGGCDFQHLSKTAYQKTKLNLFLQALNKFGIGNLPAPSHHWIPQGTRRRANFAARKTKGKIILGFHERQSGTIRDIDVCLLLTPRLTDLARKIRPYLHSIIDEGAKVDIFVQAIGDQVEIGLTGTLGLKGQSAYEKAQSMADLAQGLGVARLMTRARDYDAFEVVLSFAPVDITFGALRVSLAPGAFLQPSVEGEKILSDLVANAVQGGDHAADLFCGNGTFTGRMMEVCRQVESFDITKECIAALSKAGVTAHTRNLFKHPLREQELSAFDCVVLDPPRSGAKEQCEQMAGSQVKRVVYVSCNAQSFARDAKILYDGGYRLTEIALVDQFIWSIHSESVAVFDRA